MIKLRAPVAEGSVTHAGVAYAVVDGRVSVPHHAVAALAAHGYRTVPHEDDAADLPGPVRPADTACNCFAVTAKLAEAEDKLRVATDRLGAERDARGLIDGEVARLVDALAAEQKARAEERAAAVEAVTRLSASLEAEKAARAEAEAFAKLAADEVAEKSGKASAKAASGK